MENPSELKEIVELSDSIRKKYEALKRGYADTEVLLQKTFKPIVDPLQTLIQEKKNRKTFKPIDDPLQTIVQRKKRMKLENVGVEAKAEINTDIRNDDAADEDDNDDDDEVFPKNLRLKTLAESKPIVDKVLEKVLSTPAGTDYVKTLLEQYGPLAAKYMALYVVDDKTIDKSYHGLRYINNEWLFGNKSFTVDKNDNIFINNIEYQGTPGLFELIFSKDPNQSIITKHDYDTYIKILNMANVLKRKYNPSGTKQGSRTKKYISIIAPHLRSKSGTGLAKQYNANAPDWIYWDDPNELVERLMLIVASKDAGHTGHDNEILSIMEELREAGYIE